MDPQQWQRVKAVFTEILEQQAARRTSLLEELSRTHPDLHAEVASLLAAHESTGLTVPDDPPDGQQRADGSWSQYNGRRFGAYRVVGLIGHGGMGAVFLAERADGEFERQVALKIVRSAFAGPMMAHRLRRERQILASLTHPHIAHLLDGGVGEEGEPFFVMELVEGLPIDTYCAREALTTRQRLVLFLTVCRAVAHAHGQQVVHSDLKPANILVTATGVPKLLDFGIARMLDDRGDTEPATAEYRAFTPDYASPEQLEGKRTLTPASDVFSLGVLLDRLLSVDGHPLPAELRAVSAMAQRSEPGSRYLSARELGDDIARFLDGRPVAARPEGLRDRVTVAVGRRRLLVTAAGIAAVVALGALGAGNMPAWPGRERADAGTTDAARLPHARAPIERVRTLAVLPLAGASEDTDTPMRVGLAHAIAARLGESPRLVVRPIDATLGFLDDARDPIRAGRDLQVDAVLTGTLERTGEAVAAHLRLIDIGTGEVLWTGRPTSAAAAVLQGASSIPDQVAAHLDPGTGDDGPARPDAALPSLAAQDAYLRGTLALASVVRQASNIFTARDAFELAIRLEPDFVRAQAALATTYAMAGALNILAPQEAYPKAERAARRALETAPDLPLAHSALADVEADYNWNWAAAEAHYERAIALAPNVAPTRQAYSEFLARMGRFTEAARESARARQLDPTRVNYVALRAMHLYLEHRFDDAVAEAQEALARDPRTYLAHLYLSVTHAARGDYQAGLAAGQRATALTGGAVPDLFVTACNYALMNDRPRTDALLARLHALSRTRYVDPFHFVAIHAYLGDTDQAFAWLDRSYQQRSYWMTSLKVHPVVDALRGDSRFAAMMRRMRLE